MDTKTLKNIVKIITVVLALSYLIDKVVFYGLNSISDKVMTGQSIGKLNHFLSVKDSVDILIFGNSRANHHFDTYQFKKSIYNIGTDGSGIAHLSTLINTLDEKKEQLIIVHLDTKDFFDDNYKGEDLLGLKSKYSRNKIITQRLDESKKVSILQKFYNCINYNGLVLGILKNYFKPGYDYKLYNGYDPLFVNNEQNAMRDLVLTKNDAESKACNAKLKLNTKAYKYLKYIKDFSDRSNKKFVFITSPIFNDNCNEDNIMLSNTLQELNLNYFDYTRLYKNSSDKALWKDKTHMSDEGAKKFTKHLMKTHKFLN